MPIEFTCIECGEQIEGAFGLDIHLMEKHGYNDDNARTEVLRLIRPMVDRNTKKIDENQKLVG